jgi:hypothetical protein
MTSVCEPTDSRIRMALQRTMSTARQLTGGRSVAPHAGFRAGCAVVARKATTRGWSKRPPRLPAPPARNLTLMRVFSMPGSTLHPSLGCRPCRSFLEDSRQFSPASCQHALGALSADVREVPGLRAGLRSASPRRPAGRGRGRTRGSPPRGPGLGRHQSRWDHRTGCVPPSDAESPESSMFSVPERVTVKSSDKHRFSKCRTRRDRAG